MTTTNYRFPGSTEIFALDLSGEVGAQHMLRLANGRHPGDLRARVQADGSVQYRSTRRLQVRTVVEVRSWSARSPMPVAIGEQIQRVRDQRRQERDGAAERTDLLELYWCGRPSTPAAITVRIIDGIELTAREADFLRQMARHCIATHMPGSMACSRLVALLDAARVPEREDEPVYGIFEPPGSTPPWIKP